MCGIIICGARPLAVAYLFIAFCVIIFIKVWDFTVIRDATRLVTGCADSELRVWEIKYKDRDTEQRSESIKTSAKRKKEDEDDDDDQPSEAGETENVCYW